MKSPIASMQYAISPADLSTVLALARARTLAQAGLQQGLNASTVFRTIQRIEKGLGQRLFERSRSGYRPTELGERLCRHAETIEDELLAARGASSAATDQISGTVRIGAVDAVLHSFVVPVLKPLLAAHPQLRLELQASNELTSLTHRDVDIALRSTERPPEHLVGKRLGTMQFAVYGARSLSKTLRQADALSLQRLAGLPWIGVDESMPDHPGVVWRKQSMPKVQPILQVNNMLTAVQAIEAGLGIGVVALFHARRHKALVPLTAPLKHCTIDLWLLTHPESRHLRRIAAVARHIEQCFLPESMAQF